MLLSTDSHPARPSMSMSDKAAHSMASRAPSAAEAVQEARAAALVAGLHTSRSFRARTKRTPRCWSRSRVVVLVVP